MGLTDAENEGTPMLRTRTALTAALVAVALLLTGCGGDDAVTDDATAGETATSASPSDDAGAEPSEDPTAEESEEPEDDGSDKPLPQGPFADLVFDGDQVSPNGERVKLGVGETLTLRIDSDRPGELHVHSTPEQEIEFPAGQSERKLTIEQPGVVEVEEHDSGKVLLQLQVS